MENPAVAKKGMPWYLRLLVGKNPLVTLGRALVWAALLVVLFKFVLLGIRVKGESMEPTLHDGTVKFINRIAYMKSKPQRGDIVAVRAPGLRAVFLKRIIGLPGERLIIRKGVFYINGQPLDEPYAKGLTSYTEKPVFEVLEPNQYFVIGDNRAISEAWYKYDYQIIGKLLY